MNYFTIKELLDWLSLSLSEQEASRPRRRATHRTVLEILEDRTLLSFIGSANYPLVAPGSSAIGLNPTYTATGDFDGDGRLDLVTVNSGSNNISVFLNVGNGQFAAPVNYAAGTNPTAIAVGDLNHDGKLDLAISDSTIPGTITIFIGNGDGNFSTDPAMPVSGFPSNGNTPSGIVLGDFNHDSKADVAVLNSSSGSLHILLGNNDGTFPISSNITGLTASSASQSLAVGDFNSDGWSDLVVGNDTANSLTTLVNKKTAGVTFTSTVIATGSHTSAVAVSDINSDGKLDIVAVNYQVKGEVNVLTGKGNGTFAAYAQYATNYVYPDAVALGDVNGDGLTDIIVADKGNADLVSELLNASSSPFTTIHASRVDSVPVSVAVGDFNGDGALDLAIANKNSSDLSVLLNQGSGSYLPPAHNNNGTGPGAVVATDLNNDGTPDLAITDYNTGTVSVVQVSAGSSPDYSAPIFTGFVGGNPYSIASADFNSDGNMDLVTTNSADNTISVLMGNGNLTFKSQVTYAVGNDPTGIATVDVNHDGKPDLIITNYLDNDISVLINKGDGSGIFLAAVTYAVGNGPIALAVADFSGDGSPDIAVTNANGNTVSVLINNGDGTYAAPATYAVGSYPDAIAVGDLNGDNKPDLVVANENGNTVSTLVNTGAGAFKANTTITVGNAPDAIGLADFNGDGKLDVAVANYSDNNVTLYPNTTTTTTLAFGTAVKVTVNGGPDDLLARDLNGDSKADLLTVNYTANTFSSIQGLGNNTFDPMVSRVVTIATENPVASAIGDFNADGHADVLVVNQYLGDVSLMEGNGLGGFSSVTTAGTVEPTVAVASTAAPEAIAVGDFNGDGKLDFVTANSASNNIGVFLGNGDGTFQTVVNYPVGNDPTGIAVGDFNHDGKLDIAIANHIDGTVSILLGIGNGTFLSAVAHTVAAAPSSITLGDFNGDGNLDIATSNDGIPGNILFGTGDGLTFVAGSLGTTSPSLGAKSIVATDLNNDGKVDLVTTDTLNNSVDIFLGDGAGNFTTATNASIFFGTGSLPTSVVATDVNGNGLQDLLVALSGTNNVLLLLGNGDGSFQNPVLYATNVDPTSLSLADLAGNHTPGFVSTNSSTGNLNVNLDHITYNPAIAPTLNNDDYTVVTGQTLTVTAAKGVLANDADPDKLGLIVSQVNGLSGNVGAATTTTHGTVTLSANGSFTYVSSAGFHGVDSFTYAAFNAFGVTTTASVAITIDTPPGALNIGFPAKAGQTTVESAANGILLGGSDFDGDALVISLIENANGQLATPGQPLPTNGGGTVIVNRDGSFRYSPSFNFTGIDSFSYTVSDSFTGETASATVYLGSYIVLGISATNTFIVTAISSKVVDLNLNGTDLGNLFLTAGFTINYDGVSGTDSIQSNSAAVPLIINGGTGTTTLTLASTVINNLWEITGTNTGTVNLIAFSIVQNLIGGSGADTFQFIGSGFISGNVDGGAGTGINTLDYSQANYATVSSLNYTNFATPLPNLSLNGTAALVTTSDGSVLRVISSTIGAKQSQAGSAFNTQLVGVAGFNTSFTFRMTARGGASDVSGHTGADGLVFVLQDGSPYKLGGVGGGIGYNGLFPNSIAIAFDTWENTQYNDPSSNSLGIDLRGSVNHTASNGPVITVSPTFDDGNLWYAWITYDGVTLKVYAGESFTQPANPILSYAVNIPAILGSPLGYAGFTGGTASSWENADVLNWQYASTTSINANGGVLVDLNTAVASGIGGTFANIANAIGSSGSDYIVGSGAWQITGINAGINTTQSFTFTAFENLFGGDSADTFTFNTNAGLSGVLDTLNGTDLVTLGTNATAAELVGGGGADSLIAPTTVSIWDITGHNSGTIDGIPFVGFSKLTSTSNMDSFDFIGSGNLTGSIVGGGASILDFSQANATVLVNLNTNTATNLGIGFSGVNQIIGSNASTTNAITGTASWQIISPNAGINVKTGVSFQKFQIITGSGTDTLTGPLSGASWTITANNAGTLESISFSGIADLVGMAGNDTFTFAINAILSGTLTTGNGTDAIILATGASALNFGGGAGPVTLTGPNAVTTWNITATNAGTVGTIPFISIQNLIGGSGSDTFAFSLTGMLSSTLDGGSGNNTLDESATAGPVTIDLSTGLASLINGNAAGGISNLQNFISPSATTNSFTGPTGTATWSITAANAGTVNADSFKAFQNLHAASGSGMNDFGFGTSGSLTGSLTGNSNSTLDYSPSSAAVFVNIATNTATAIAGTFASIQAVIGSSNSSDTLTGPASNTIWTLNATNAGSLSNSVSFSAFPNLLGGTGNDTYRFLSGASISGSVDGGGGSSNSLDYTSFGARTVVTLATNAATGVHSLSSNHIAHIQSAIGSTAGNISGSTGNLFVGPNTTSPALTTWNITVANGGNLNLSTGIFTFASFPSLTGGNGNDTFKMISSARLDGSADGGAGTNILDYTGYSNRVVVSLATNAASGIKNLSGSGIANFQTILGSPNTSNLIVATNADSTWNITAADAGTLTPTAYGPISFSSFANLTGGFGKDSFVFKADASVSGAIDGRITGGVNTLDYSAYGARIVFSLANSSATAVHNSSGSSVYDFQNIIGSTSNNIAGSTGNLLVGPSTATTWHITANNAGQLGTTPITFTAFPNLTGSTGNDDFIFSNGITLLGSIDGGLGTGKNTLDYSTWTTPVTVNLASSTATGMVKAFDIQNVLGGSGNDTITGSSAGGILVGNGGVDTITSGAGRSVIIGGAGNDIVTGGPNGDILIQGTTSYDNNLAALLAILSEWQSTATLTNRVAALRAGTGLAAGNKLIWGSSVIDDGGSNSLTGYTSSPTANEFDWFFANQAIGHDILHATQTSDITN